MTTKTITLAEEKIQTIQKGTVVKLGDDLFIVTETEASKNVDLINDALFSPKKPMSTLRTTVYCHGQKRVEAKYNLVSFMTGGLFYDENVELRTLARNMTNHDFRVVDKIEFIESNCNVY
ncbi:hypothetical protein [Bacillus cereus]|uniref:Uncharacterized protein n=1 Tax=Bacillus cereus TaxID=1396 RepID=A0ABD4LMI5_BACCE|nr:hypothetical protein [Bacillus cereus]MBK1611695.1 hypothetical protein [Bacillus cereus]